MSVKAFAAWALPALVLGVPVGVHAEPATSAAALLGQMCRAGGDARQAQFGGAEVSGEIEEGGLTGVFSEKIDLQQGRDVTVFDLGATKGAEGTDPRGSWATDEKGLTNVQDSPDAVADALTSSYVDRDAWCRPDPEARIEALGPRKTPAGAFQLVRVDPPGARPLTVWIDAATHLPARVDYRDSLERENTVTLSDYRRVDGVWYAFFQRTSTGDPKNDQVERIDRVRFRAAFPNADFAPPQSVISDARLLSGGGGVKIPFVMRDGLIFVDVSINDAKPLPFLFDSGAANALTPRAAAALGLTGQGSVPLNGAGEAQAQAQLARVRSFRLGPAELDDQQFVVVALPGLYAGGSDELAGVIGYEFLRRFVVRIDYHDRELTVWPADAGPPPQAGDHVRLYFDSRESYVRASVDGVEGYFGVDTGDDGAVMLFKSFYADHSLPIELPGIPSSGIGLGGAIPTLLTRVETLALGPFTLSHPLAEVGGATAGGFASSRLAGNLGSQILRNFILTFDYPHQALYVARSPDFAYVMPYNRTGLALNSDANDVVSIGRLAPDSAAAKAGLRLGDQLLAIDGHDVRGLSFLTLADGITAPAGQRINLALSRGGKPFAAVVIASEPLPPDGPFAVAPKSPALTPAR